MKTTTRIPAPIQAYTDDGGRPVCGKCKLNFDTRDCEYSSSADGPEYFLLPGPSCPVWGEGSKPNGKSNITKCGHGTESHMACRLCQLEVEVASYLESQSKEVVGKLQAEEREYAEWSDRDCPKCENGGVVAKDRFGIYCVVSGCSWREDFEEVKDNE